MFLICCLDVFFVGTIPFPDRSAFQTKVGSLADPAVRFR